jgi:hypothetical protein
MSAEKGFYAILFLCLISFSFQDQQDNWTIYNNSIIINSYVSGLTEEERDNYFYWVGLRNSFYFSEDSNQLEKLVKYFTPENDDYYKTVFNFSVPGLVLAGVALLVFFIYLIQRFILKGCAGPKIVEDSYHNITYFLIVFGCIAGLTFHIFVIYNASKSK